MSPQAFATRKYATARLNGLRGWDKARIDRLNWDGRRIWIITACDAVGQRLTLHTDGYFR